MSEEQAITIIEHLEIMQFLLQVCMYGVCFLAAFATIVVIRHALTRRNLVGCVAVAVLGGASVASADAPPGLPSNVAGSYFTYNGGSRTMSWVGAAANGTGFLEDLGGGAFQELVTNDGGETWSVYYTEGDGWGLVGTESGDPLSVFTNVVGLPPDGGEVPEPWTLGHPSVTGKPGPSVTLPLIGGLQNAVADAVTAALPPLAAAMAGVAGYFAAFQVVRLALVWFNGVGGDSDRPTKDWYTEGIEADTSAEALEIDRRNARFDERWRV